MKEESFQLPPSSKINRVRKRTLQEEYADRELELKKPESLEKIKAAYERYKPAGGGVTELMADEVALETFKIEAMSAVFGEAYLNWMDDGEQSRLKNKIIKTVKELENPAASSAEKAIENPAIKTIPTRRKEPSEHWLDTFERKQDEANEANRKN